MVFPPPETEEAKLQGGGEEKRGSKSSICKGSEERVSIVLWKKLWLIQPKEEKKKAVRDEGKKLSRDHTGKGFLCFTKLRSLGITLKIKRTHPKGLSCSVCEDAHTRLRRSL